MTEVLKVRDLEVDTYLRRVTLDGEVIDLSPNVYQLLVILAGEPHRVFPINELVELVYGPLKMPKTRPIASAACRLRAALGDDWVKNVWGVGYRLVP